MRLITEIFQIAVNNSDGTFAGKFARQVQILVDIPTFAPNGRQKGENNSQRIFAIQRAIKLTVIFLSFACCSFLLLAAIKLPLFYSDASLTLKRQMKFVCRQIGKCPANANAMQTDPITE